jgi:DNA primase
MAGRIPEKFIDELLTRIDIVDVIDARVPLRKAGKDYKACCPFHEEKTPSFTVSQDKQFYHCFGCGVHGSAIGFLMEYEHMSFPEAVEDLAARAGVSVVREQQGGAYTPGMAKDELANLSDLLQQADRYYRRQLREHPSAQSAVEYLKGRGLSGAIAADFGLGFAPDGWDNLLRAIGTDAATQEALVTAGLAVKKDNGGYYDRFRQRVMFPIHDYRGRLIGFGGRVVGKGEPKYLNSPETPLFHKGRELYGLFRARDALRRERRALVVEGYMDVVALAQFGIDYAVATLGTATTRDHLERLFRFTPEVVFCFDGDRAGREAAWRALENALPVMQEGRQASFLFLPDGEDPDSLVRKEGREGFSARVAQGLSLPDYLFQTLSEQVDLARLDGRARLAELARPLLSSLPPGILRQLMVNRLAELTHLAAENLSTLITSGEGARRPPAEVPPRPPVRRPAVAQHSAKGVPTLMQAAVALLLLHPHLVQHVPETGFLQGLTIRGGDFLADLVALLRARPELKTGFIIEHYRDSEYQPHLAKLAAWQHPMLQQDVDAEFLDLFQQLRRHINKQQTEMLTQKECLDDAEKTRLHQLLVEKQALNRMH